MSPINIVHIAILGDSLTDRGTMDHRYLFDLIPMSFLSGLAGHSPYGRFTNGFTWSDFLSAMLADEFIINILKNKYGLDDTDIADAVLSHDPHAEKLLFKAYSLDNDRFVQFEGQDFIRCYDEGGLSAHDYKWVPSTSIKCFFSRLILSTLEAKREALLAYDEAHELSRKHKEETLIIEWSGANDLITVNPEPSEVEADLAVKARLKNAEILIKNGYHHFILFNLPDLSLTPRFQNMTGEEGEIARQNAHECCAYFNEELEKGVERLRAIYPHTNIDVFDVSSVFSEVYNNPEQHGFDKDKIKQPYVTSSDFKIEKNGSSPAPGYMFWDDVHPSATMHAKLVEYGYRKFKFDYKFSAPQVEVIQEKELTISEEELRASFIIKYGEVLKAKKGGFFGCHHGSKFNYKAASLEEILSQVFEKKDSFTRDVITDLQWIDKKGNLYLNIPALKEAMGQLEFNSLTMDQLIMDN